MPAGRGTRPTSDRAREGLFSSLESLRGGSLAGARVLDLYAGSGAIGLEALSRGAVLATLVERDRQAVGAIRRNIATLDLPGADVRAEAVEKFVEGAPSAYDVVVLDPPYDDPVDRTLHALLPWLAVDAVVVVERATRGPALTWPAGIDAERERRYGEGTLWYGRATAGERAT